MAHDNRPIGIFDSGFGGLTVVAALRRRLPNEHIIYLGDTARVPYGSKSRDTIVRFACDDAAFLISREVKAVIIACNTVSAIAIPALEERWPDMPFLGVVEAGVTLTLAEGAPKRVMVIGTAATVGSDSYRMLLHRADPEISVRSIACPLFVPLVEEGWTDTDIARAVCRRYLEPAITNPPDALILGCTHYPLLKPLIREIIPDTVCIVDSAEACAAAAGDFIRAGRGASPDNDGRQQFYVTDMPASFFSLASRFLGEPLREVDKVSLD